MIKLRKFIFLFVLLVLSVILLTGCDSKPDKKDSKEPTLDAAITLEKSSFKIYVQYNNGNEPNYILTWNAKGGIVNFIVEQNGEEINNGQQGWIYLKNFKPDVIHNVKVTACSIGANKKLTEPVEIKLKGIKLPDPTNFYMQYDTGFVWDSTEQWYGLEFKEFTLNLSNQKEYTGETINITAVENQYLNYYIRSNMLQYKSDKLFEAHVRSIPEIGKEYNFTESTEVLEIDYPSDYSQTDIKILGAQMSNPANVRWDLNDGISQMAKVCWDSVSSSYKYWVRVDYPGGWSSGYITNAGASFGYIDLDYRSVTGNYTLGIQSVCNDVELINLGAFYAYKLYISQPTDNITFSVNQTILQKPQNIRFEGENLVWDSVEYAREYIIKFAEGDSYTNVCSSSSGSATLTLQQIYDSFNGNIFVNDIATSYDDIFYISIFAEAISPALASFENNHPVFNVYHYSDYSDINNNAKIKIKSIDAPQNVILNVTDKEITWESVFGASGYSVYFETGEIGVGTRNIPTTYYSWKNLFNEENMFANGKVKTVTVTAQKDFETTVQDGLITIFVSSSTVVFV